MTATQFGVRNRRVFDATISFNTHLQPMGPYSSRFERRTLKASPPLVGSYCRACGAFVGASSGPATLKLAEKAHTCPKKPARNRPAGTRPR